MLNVLESAALTQSELYFRKRNALTLFLRFLCLSFAVCNKRKMNVWEQHRSQLCKVETSCSCCVSASLLGRVCPRHQCGLWAGRRHHAPRIPFGITAEFFHRMFHRPLDLVGIQSSQSFFIWGSQLLSINCTPNGAVGSKAPSSVVLGKENCCPSQKRRSWNIRPLTSSKTH